MSTTHYKRILLKLSGEALMGDQSYGIDPSLLSRVANEIVQVCAKGVQVGLVIGGGNIYRGAALAADGMDRVAGDHMGMLATVMNAVAMQQAIRQAGKNCHILSAFPVGPIAETFSKNRAMELLASSNPVIFAAGTGNPFFTTDTAASLRAIEIEADILLKATKVDGIYSDDPVKNPDAKLYEELTYQKVLDEELAVMDMTAILLCRDHALPLRVFNLFSEGHLDEVIQGKAVGTLVQG